MNIETNKNNFDINIEEKSFYQDFFKEVLKKSSIEKLKSFSLNSKNSMNIF